MRSNTKNVQQARQAAQRLYKKVNFDGGNLQTYQLSSLLQQTYDFLKLQFKPTSNDLKDYTKVLDANGDGFVSLQDFETKAVEYLCGQGVLGQTGIKKSVGFSQSQYSQSQHTGSKDYLSYGSNQNNYKNNQYENQNYGNFASDNASQSQYSSQQQSYIKTAYNPYKHPSSYDGSSYQSPSIGAGTFYQQNQNQSQSQNQSYNSYNYTTPLQTQNTYSLNQRQTISQTQEHLASKQYNQSTYLNTQQTKSKYTPTAQNYLNITRGLFKKYSNANSNTITRDKVAVLLTQTYGALGRKGYYPSEQDVSVWMKLCDTNSDGHVQEAEYQYFVVRALQRSGIQVNS